MGAGQYGDGTWTATAIFYGGTSRLEADAVLESSQFQWNIPGSETSQLLAQPYSFSVQVSDGTDRYTVQAGVVTVLADPLTSTGGGELTMLQQQLAQLDQTILAIASKQVTMMDFGTKQYTLHNLKDLYAIRNSLAIQVQAEQDKLSGQQRSRRILPRFVRNY